VQDELKTYQEENPEFVPLNLKATLTRDEKQLQERSAGKPEKPPNSGYSLFSRMMLTSEEIKKVNSKQRMAQISQMWKILSVSNKRKYHDKVQQVCNNQCVEVIPDFGSGITATNYALFVTDAGAIQARFCNLP
jgi:hypothetical protein